MSFSIQRIGQFHPMSNDTSFCSKIIVLFLYFSTVFRILSLYPLLFIGYHRMNLNGPGGRCRPIYCDVKGKGAC